MQNSIAHQQGTENNEKRILELLTGLFIIEGKKAGMNVSDLRTILKIKNSKISNITKRMKSHTTEE